MFHKEHRLIDDDDDEDQYHHPEQTHLSVMVHVEFCASLYWLYWKLPNIIVFVCKLPESNIIVDCLNLSTYLSNWRYGLKWDSRASILSSSPKAKNGINLIKACSTVGLDLTKGELILSSIIRSCSLSPHCLENSWRRITIIKLQIKIKIKK